MFPDKMHLPAGSSDSDPPRKWPSNQTFASQVSPLANESWLGLLEVYLLGYFSSTSCWFVLVIGVRGHVLVAKAIKACSGLV